MGLVIDTSTVAPHERTELWSATTSALFFPSEMSFGAAASYAGWMAQYTLGPLDLFRVRGHGPLTLDRTRRGIVCADPEFFALSILLRGRLRARQEDRASHVGPGSCRCTTPRCPSGCARTRRSTSSSSRCPRPCSAHRPTGSRITARTRSPSTPPTAG